MIAAVALLTGFAVMVVELSAVRMLASSFGDSAPVWTNVIGVILAALALGAVTGGWLADRGNAHRILPVALLVSGGLVLLAPMLAPRVAAWILPEALPLDRALAVLIEGSLAVSLLVFAPAVLLLGAVSPLLIRLGSESAEETVGRVSGLVYATGTVGSLIGTFLATHVLVPRLGVSGAFLFAGVSLCVAGALALAGRGSLIAGGIALLATLGAVVPAPPPVWLAEGDEIVEQRESYYQLLRVIEGREPMLDRPRRIRSLKINEGLDSYHSVWIDGSPFTNGRYYDSFALLPFLRGDVESGEELRVLSLGCAAGSILRVLRAVVGEERLAAVGVDLDPDVIELGRKWFGLPEDGARQRMVGNLDARVYVERVREHGELFDLICVDTYRNQIYLPPHLTSVEFFRAVRARLTKAGVVALNVGDLSHEGPVISAVAGTLAAVFPCVESFRVARARNFLLFGHSGSPGRMPSALSRSRRPAGLSEKLWGHAMRPGAYRTWKGLPESECLTDLRSNLGKLHERIYGRLPVRVQ